MFVHKIIGLSWASALLFGSAQAHSTNNHRLPTRDIAGISVINTPIVKAAEAFALDHSSHAVYKHVMRSWLYGVLMLDANDTLSRDVDREVHAVATLLHDLGWDKTENSSIITTDRRFEVDGAIAAREFIHTHKDGKHWQDRRVQLVWDAIALHTERSLSYFKELDVQVVSKGISLDFSGPGWGVSTEKYAAVEKVYPKFDLKDSVNSTFIWLCATKPHTTYDTWMQPFGERYVEGYDLKGKQRIDIIFQNLTSGGN